MYYGLEADAYNAMCHSGIKGQKWHRRRYQNPDGSLTPLGRLHYGRLKRQKAREAKQGYKVEQKRSVLDWTDDELRSGKNRADLEKNYLKTINERDSELSKYNQARQSKVKKALKKIGNKAVTKVVEPYAEYQIKKYINKASGEKIFDLSNGIGGGGNKKKKKGNNNNNDD